jgi:hypothetical protein
VAHAYIAAIMAVAPPYHETIAAKRQAVADLRHKLALEEAELRGMEAIAAALMPAQSETETPGRVQTSPSEANLAWNNASIG